MSRRRPQPAAIREEVLECVRQDCPECGGSLWNKYDNYRSIRTLNGVVRLRLKVRRCQNPNCKQFRCAYRPEQEGKWALPQYEFGLDVMALVGAWRYQEHRSVPQICQQLQQRGVCISQRSVSNLLERYDELLAISLSDSERINTILGAHKQVILAIDGLQPDRGHEVLWVIRECQSGELLLARTLLSARHQDLAQLLKEVKQVIQLPIAGVISDGQQSIRQAVKTALPEVAHALCHFHYLREAAKGIYEADRHAKKELKKQVRGVRALEHSVSNDDNLQSEVVQGYCLAVRSALTDDGRPPLAASGLQLQKRLTQIQQSLERLEQQGSSHWHLLN